MYVGEAKTPKLGGFDPGYAESNSGGCGCGTGTRRPDRLAGPWGGRLHCIATTTTHIREMDGKRSVCVRGKSVCALSLFEGKKEKKNHVYRRQEGIMKKEGRRCRPTSVLPSKSLIRCIRLISRKEPKPEPQYVPGQTNTTPRIHFTCNYGEIPSFFFYPSLTPWSRLASPLLNQVCFFEKCWNLSGSLC